MKIDLARHRELQSQGVISIQQHPEFPLLIHNYSQRCQWERLWDETTLICRGLITDPQGNVVCRPFPKFFNLGEHTAEGSKLPPITWKQEFYVSEKLDGSLIIAYLTPTGYRAATRGSFESPQSVIATEMLHGLNSHRMSTLYTYCFEFIHPSNRIVIDYGNRSELVLLDVIHTETGHGMSRVAIEDEALRLGCSTAANHELLEHELEWLANSNESDREGVVVRFEDGMRIKIKVAEYCRLHKLITGLNTKAIWEMLRDGKSLADIVDRVPDEFFKWVKQTVNDLMNEFDELKTIARIEVELAREDLGDAPRKAYAERFVKMQHVTPLLFLEYDGRDVAPAIWKKLKPESAVAFAESEE